MKPSHEVAASNETSPPGGAYPQPRHGRHAAISMAESDDVRAAWLFAIRQGWPPTQFVSFNWARAPSAVAPDPMARLTRVRDMAKAFFYRHAPGLPFVWIEVREKPRINGEGAHWAIHVPAALLARFTLAAPRWVAHGADSFEPDAVDVRPIGRWWDRLDYMMKAGEPDVRVRHNTKRFRKPNQGVIYGPRVRVSHSIGPTARAIAEREAVCTNVVPFTPRPAALPLITVPPALMAA